MKYYIGVDGGGTKTAYALFDENKNCLAQVKTRGSNHENLDGSFDEAAEIIMQGINSLVETAGIALDDVSGTLMGLAGVDHDYQHDILCALFEQRGLRNFHVYNDGFLVIKAGSPDGTGIGYNCGTGTCCNSIDSNGRLLQVGGFSDLSGDCGNGPWIAARVFRAVYDDVCLHVNKTLLTHYVCECFGITADRSGVLSLIPDLEQQKSESVMALIDIFFGVLNRGDDIAAVICEEMAERGAQFIAAHVAEQSFAGDEINVVLSGSIHTKLPCKAYLYQLNNRASQLSGRRVRLILLDVEPVVGCVNWLLEIASRPKGKRFLINKGGRAKSFYLRRTQQNEGN